MFVRYIHKPGLGGHRGFWTKWGTRPGHQFGLHFDSQMTANLWLRDLQWILKICKVKKKKAGSNIGT